MEPSFILALFQHGYKVRTSTLYHLLKGKRTSSVLLYGFLYENLRFFQLFPLLSDKQFHTIIKELGKQDLLNLTSDGEAQITSKGIQVAVYDVHHFSWINNYRFGKTDETIWRLLQFTVQVVSNLSYTNKHYVPLEQSPLYQKQVKMYIKSMPKAQLIETVKKEWTLLFSHLTNDEANFFAQQFSGYQQIGKTSFQLMKDDDNTFERQLYKKEKLHHLLDTICLMPDGSFLKKLVLPLVKQNENKSMSETSSYMKTQLPIEALAQKRRVKISTIKDHLMELALTKDFPFERFISKETEQFLFEYPKPYQEWTYRSVKQNSPELDYFEFRLYQIQKIREERESRQ
ncbi:hypothetical protein UAW_01217 [Enterococcus haemoperoxidus ATCC BAA-382]|uniref:Helicase Helix-turn-helix domain-containing protein n=1 Tax=Enterococcus haemoperoxidus ATCC BAA-382 TaxID=1158608 RepID=R2T0P0_9ENTE|nr:helix-turn-helix domain-containing protein [Enterococcus haemoperoxidus]EOH98621.1 hypothetical protein UAW_01217 [Enterococcus haemoperoxidus ATCC BAA-382]EOT62196.1 hypothetical protein I583_01196 [Enterococcus haemoperoxidus ATCC BAA-382]OJG55722.1 hypothetical protein RV06_GL001304 [Enterococcus haemoperoxidus]